MARKKKEEKRAAILEMLKLVGAGLELQRVVAEYEKVPMEPMKAKIAAYQAVRAARAHLCDVAQAMVLPEPPMVP